MTWKKLDHPPNGALRSTAHAVSKFRAVSVFLTDNEETVRHTIDLHTHTSIWEVLEEE